MKLFRRALKPCITCSLVTMKENREIMINLNCEVCVQRIKSSESCDKYMKTFQSSQNLYACKKCSCIPSETSTGCTQCDLQRGRWLDRKIALKQMKLITTLFLRTQYARVNSHVNPERAARFAKKFYNVVPKMQDDEVIFLNKRLFELNQ